MQINNADNSALNGILKEIKDFKDLHNPMSEIEIPENDVSRISMEQQKSLQNRSLRNFDLLS